MLYEVIPRSDGRIHPARQSEHDLVSTYLRADTAHRFRAELGHAPIAREAADLEHEALENRFALQGMRYLGVKLDAIESPRLIRHSRDRAGRARRDHLETGRHLVDLVTMAHPDIKQAMAFRVGPILDIP